MTDDENKNVNRNVPAIERELDEMMQIKLPDGRELGAALSVDGMQLWWAFKRFITGNLLPWPFVSFADALAGQKTPFWAPFAARKAVLSRERKKWLKARKYAVHAASTQPKILFISYKHHLKNGSLYRIQGVVDKLKSGEQCAPFVLLTTRLSDRAAEVSDLQGENKYLYQFINERITKLAESEAKALSGVWKSEVKKILSEKQAYKYFAAHLNFLFSYEWLLVFLTYYFTIKSFVAEHNVKGVFLTATIGLFEKCCMFAGKLLGVPVFVMQHGSGVGFGIIEPELASITTFLVFGEKHKEKLLGMGIPEDKIIVTGSPMADEIAADVPQKSVSLGKALLITQPFVEDKLWTKPQQKIFFDMIKEVMNNMSGVSWTIKIHPREKATLYAKTFPDARVSSGDLYAEIRAADAVFGVSSTALMEALLLNRPVIVLDLFGQVDKNNFSLGELALYCTSSDEIIKNHDSYFAMYNSKKFDAKREQFVKDYFTALDGKSAERIATVVLKHCFQKDI